MVHLRYLNLFCLQQVLRVDHLTDIPILLFPKNIEVILATGFMWLDEYSRKKSLIKMQTYEYLSDQGMNTNAKRIKNHRNQCW